MAQVLPINPPHGFHRAHSSIVHIYFVHGRVLIEGRFRLLFQSLRKDLRNVMSENMEQTIYSAG
jgi:hypothetical protein